MLLHHRAIERGIRIDPIKLISRTRYSHRSRDDPVHTTDVLLNESCSMHDITASNRCGSIKSWIEIYVCASALPTPTTTKVMAIYVTGSIPTCHHKSIRKRLICRRIENALPASAHATSIDNHRHVSGKSFSAHLRGQSKRWPLVKRLASYANQFYVLIMVVWRTAISELPTEF